MNQKGSHKGSEKIFQVEWKQILWDAAKEVFRGKFIHEMVFLGKKKFQINNLNFYPND
jgi:hypothetical protein